MPEILAQIDSIDANLAKARLAWLRADARAEGSFMDLIDGLLDHRLQWMRKRDQHLN